MNRLFFVIAIACVTASGSFASPSENVIHSLGHLGITPSPEQREDIIAQYDAAQVSTDYPDWFAQSSARLIDLAELSQSATRPSAQVQLAEMHFQLLGLMASGDNTALDLVNRTNPMVHLLEPGVGMTERDIGWPMMLEAMRMNLPTDIRDMDIMPDDGKALMARVNGVCENDSIGAQQFFGPCRCLGLWDSGRMGSDDAG